MTTKYYPVPTRFCWACEVELIGMNYSSRHYLDGRLIYFCSLEHKKMHDFLSSL